MNETEFRTKLNELGTSYQLAIKRMNAVDSPSLKSRHRRAASAVIDEIQALERRHKVEGDGALGAALWEGKRQVESVKVPGGYVTAEAVDGRTWYPDGLDTEVVETWSGQQFTRSVKGPEPPIPWVEENARLIKELYDLDQKLIDIDPALASDLYPTAPAKEAKDPAASHAMEYGFSAGAIVLAGITLLTGWTPWLGLMFGCLCFAWIGRLSSRSQ